MNKGANKIPYLAGIFIKITVDVTDPACVHYIELEIDGRIKREYLQESQEKIIINDATINITMDYLYGEQEPLIVRVVDFCGNINESEWAPEPNWLNFKDQHWADPYVQLESTGKKYSYDENSLNFPNQMKKDIKNVLAESIKKLVDDIVVFYTYIYPTFNRISSWFGSDVDCSKYQYAGITLNTVLEAFESRDYDNIRLTSRAYHRPLE